MSLRRISRKDFLKLAASMSAGVALAACGAPAAPAPPAAAPASTQAPAVTEAPKVTAAPAAAGSGPVTLSIWEQQQSIDTAKGAAKAFSAKNPDVKLNWVPTPMGEVATKLLAAIAAGSGAPDLVFDQYNDMVNFAARGGKGISDLSPLMSVHNGEWPKWVLDLVTTSDGHILGIPTDIGPTAVFYRRSVFKAAGLSDAPEDVTKQLSTWNGYLDAAKKIQATGKAWIIENASGVFDILRQQGKQAYFDDNGQPIVNNDTFVSAAKFAQDMRKAKLDAASAKGEKIDSAAEMQAGTIGAYIDAAWWDIIIAIQAKSTRDKDHDWGVVPNPGGASANTGGSYYLIPDQSQNKPAAWNFASFMVASNEGLNPYMTEGLGRFLPGWKPFYTSDLFNSPDPGYGNQAWLKQFAGIVDTVPYLKPNINDGIAAEAVGQAITSVLADGTDPKQALDAAAAKIKGQI
jgi:ABC-type glycerol-3-phosphate transport system substrate-binding protein